MTPSEQRQAEFAATFKGTTNLAQRRRYQETLDRYESQRAQEGQQQYERALSAAEMADPLKAEANKIGQSREQRLRGEAIMREDRFLRQEDEKKRQFELRMQNDEKTLELRQRQELRAEEKRAKELELAAQQDEQMHRVFTEITDLALKGIRPGSPKFADAAFRLLRDNPNIPKDVRQGLHKDSGIDISLEQMDADAERFKNPNFRITRSPNGTSYTVSEAPIPKVPAARPEVEKTQLLNEYSKMIDIYNKDPGAKPFLEKPIQDMRERLKQFTSPAVPSAPAPAAPSELSVGAAPTASVGQQTAPTPQAETAPVFKTVFKDGKLVPVE